MKRIPYQQMNIFLFFSSLIIIGLNWQRLPPQIPLFYSRPWGEDQLAPKMAIFLFPTTSLGVFLTNHLLAKIFRKKQNFFIAETSLFFSLLISLLNLISLYQIINLIF